MLCKIYLVYRKKPKIDTKISFNNLRIVEYVVNFEKLLK